MVAIASLPTTAATPGRMHRAPSPARRPEPGMRRPALSLVPAPGPAARAVDGRPLGAVVATVLAVLAVLFAAAYLVRTPTVAPGAAVAGTHVVAEGETMWSIAVEYAPAGEAAGYVERLVAANDTASVVAGEELSLPTR